MGKSTQIELGQPSAGLEQTCSQAGGEPSAAKGNKWEPQGVYQSVVDLVVGEEESKYRCYDQCATALLKGALAQLASSVDYNQLFPLRQPDPADVELVSRFPALSGHVYGISTEVSAVGFLVLMQTLARKRGDDIRRLDWWIHDRGGDQLDLTVQSDRAIVREAVIRSGYGQDPDLAVSLLEQWCEDWREALDGDEEDHDGAEG